MTVCAWKSSKVGSREHLYGPTKHQKTNSDHLGSPTSEHPTLHILSGCWRCDPRPPSCHLPLQGRLWPVAHRLGRHIISTTRSRPQTGIGCQVSGTDKGKHHRGSPTTAGPPTGEPAGQGVETDPAVEVEGRLLEEERVKSASPLIGSGISQEGKEGPRVGLYF